MGPQWIICGCKSDSKRWLSATLQLIRKIWLSVSRLLITRINLKIVSSFRLTFQKDEYTSLVKIIRIDQCCLIGLT